MILVMAVRKWSVSIDEDLAERVEEHVGGRGLSGFVARAVEHELERDSLSQYLDDLDAEFGAVPTEMVEEFDRLWP
jgi:metal-responsive CopG/Arc/MetJ family transcriptional regulator